MHKEKLPTWQVEIEYTQGCLWESQCTRTIKETNPLINMFLLHLHKRLSNSWTISRPEPFLDWDSSTLLTNLIPSSTVLYRRQLPYQINFLNESAGMQQLDKKFSEETKTKNFSYHVKLIKEKRDNCWIFTKTTWIFASMVNMWCKR